MAVDALQLGDEHPNPAHAPAPRSPSSRSTDRQKAMLLDWAQVVHALDEPDDLRHFFCSMVFSCLCG
jgi:hypothetical protein